MSTNKISNEPTKPVPNPNADKKKEDASGDNSGPIVGGQKTVAKPQNVIHTIRDVFGKDDNVNRIRNVADTDITDKWAFDAYPLQLVVDLGDPAKEIDYIRICSDNEQAYTLDFSNDNTLEGYSRAQKGTLKRGLNDIKLPTDIVARYFRFDFPGNKDIDENKDQKPDPLGIYYVQAGSGEINTSGTPLPEPSPVVPGPTPEPGPTEPAKPTEGRIKDWGADINKGADKWRIIRMNKNNKLYKVTDEAGVNIADMFTTPEKAQEFVAWNQWKQGQEPVPPVPEPPTPGPTDPPVPPVGGTGEDKFGTKLLLSDGSDINYTVRNNFRDDGKRFDLHVGEWAQSEATGYFRFTQNPVDDEVSIKWSVVPHSGSNHVKCYDSGVSIKTGDARLRWEDPHPNYSGNLGKGKGVPLNDKFIGYKGTKTVGTDGSVTIKLYQDTGNNEGDKPANQWKQIFSHTDTKYKETGPHPEVTLRIDDPAKKGQKNLEAKWISVAKI